MHRGIHTDFRGGELNETLAFGESDLDRDRQLTDGGRQPRSHSLHCFRPAAGRDRDTVFREGAYPLLCRDLRLQRRRTITEGTGLSRAPVRPDFRTKVRRFASPKRCSVQTPPAALDVTTPRKPALWPVQRWSEPGQAGSSAPVYHSALVSSQARTSSRLKRGQRRYLLQEPPSSYSRGKPAGRSRRRRSI